MNANEFLKDFVNRKWTGICLRIISVILAKLMFRNNVNFMV